VSQARCAARSTHDWERAASAGNAAPRLIHVSPVTSLVIQSILPVKNALESKEAMIWLWGKEGAEEYKRPFKAAPGMFGELCWPCCSRHTSHVCSASGMGGPQGPQTDKAAIAAAERAGGASAAGDKKAE